ncbi:hypothetical protein IAU60_001473 [Kwoniella sp. DSM 27419]
MLLVLPLLPLLPLLAGQVNAQSPLNHAYDSLLFTEDFYPIIRSRLDPIVTPGKVSGHVHLVVGSSAFSADEDHNDARTGACTSSNLDIDRSNYWAPQLYYKWKNGTYSPVVGGGMTAYWKYPLVNTNLSHPFANIPNDFRMLGGNISRDDYDVRLASNKAVQTLCVDANGSYDYTGHLPIDRECLTMRSQLHFPECWNGVDAYKKDNSHVAYPVDGNPEGGQCPEGFVKLPHLFMETTYHIHADNIGEGYEWYPGCFVFSNGDNHGYTFHADWLNGYPTGFLVDAFNACYNNSTGLIERDCKYVKRFRKDSGADCVTEGDVVGESIGIEHPLPRLPGDNREFNSSKYSHTHSKQKTYGYSESAKIFKVSNKTGGFCVRGVCTEFNSKGGANASFSAAASNRLSKLTSKPTSSPSNQTP